MLTFVENYVIILHIFKQLIFFKYDRFFLIKNETFVRTADPCFCCSFHFIVVLFYKLHSLKNYVTCLK
jgi:hypothetical protein